MCLRGVGVEGRIAFLQFARPPLMPGDSFLVVPMSRVGDGLDWKNVTP